MLGEIDYPFPNFNDAAVGFEEWIGNFHSDFTGRMIITYPCLF